MAKLGRNDPCPCGSGKKYKKCCWAEPRASVQREAPLLVPAQAPAALSPAPIAAGTGGAGVRLTDTSGEMPPYAAAKWYEASPEYARLKRTQPRRARRRWTPSKVARLDTEALEARLEALGVHTSCEAFQTLAEGRESAWTLGEQWAADLARPISADNLELLSLAACELWKRWCPQRPSVEMLDDAMQQGYRYMMAGESAEACACWQDVWARIHARLRPEMRTVGSAVTAFDGTQVLFNWLQDFALELYNATAAQPEHARQGQQLCRQVLEQFPDEDERYVLNFRAALGEFLYLSGEEAEGERELVALIRDHPERAVGYARLAEMLGYGPSPARGPLDPKRAQALLEEALAKPVVDATDYDLKNRLVELRKAHRSHEKATGPPSVHANGAATKPSN